MITYKIGDIFAEDAEALVNCVNCVGIMGRGIALQFKNVFPENFQAYAEACQRKEVQPGQMFVFETGQLTNPSYIINFPTKRHWRGKSRMEDVESGLQALVHEIRVRRIRSIAIPPLGSDLGGLNWGDVRPRIEAELRAIDDLDVVLFEPGSGSADGRRNRSKNVPAMTSGRAALVSLMDRYLGGLLDPFVTLLEVHKLMYFMQVAGEPLRLNFQKAHYGPYAENLRHVLKDIEGHLISGYADGGDAPGTDLYRVMETVVEHLKINSDEGVQELYGDTGWEGAAGYGMLRYDYWAALPRIRARTLVLHGSGSPLAEQHGRFIEGIPNAAGMRPESESLLNIDDDPERFARIVIDFLDA